MKASPERVLCLCRRERIIGEGGRKTEDNFLSGSIVLLHEGRELKDHGFQGCVVAVRKIEIREGKKSGALFLALRPTCANVQLERKKEFKEISA